VATSGFGPTALATPANAITLARVVMMPALIGLILGSGRSWEGFALWFVLSVSDVADGWLARRHGTTRSGAFLDPLADKIIVLGAMTALVAKGVVWWLPVSLIALRELGVSAYRSYVGRRGVSVPARLSGKVKTWVQDSAVALALVPATSDALDVATVTVLWTAVGITLTTGVQYLLDGRQVIRAL